MLEHEAIEKIKEKACNNRRISGLCNDGCMYGKEKCVFSMAIGALEEIQQYRAIGTLEECLQNKDFLSFLADKMNPNDFETYLSLYNSQDKKAGGADAQANS